MTLLVTAECVDDLINDVHQAILADGLSNDPTKGSTLEILGEAVLTMLGKYLTAENVS